MTPSPIHNPKNEAAIKRCLLECVRAAGEVLLTHFGSISSVNRKESAASVVCAADWAAERNIVERIRARFPTHGILAEESGFTRGSAPYTWVIDPLDGTSNFVAGIPWFGVQIGVLRDALPILAAIYLPTDDRLYVAEAGQGVRRNNQPIRVTSERRLDHILCAIGLDYSGDEADTQRDAALLGTVAAAVRNVRATNSVVDFCLTLDGRLGGFINTSTRVWDIVPVALMLPEAGGKLSDLAGQEIAFDLTADIGTRTFGVIGASAALHPKLLAVATSCRPRSAAVPRPRTCRPEPRRPAATDGVRDRRN